ncbi:hypothetical protein [Aliarcobacter butzleri]|uniref:hypothetical protein n=1 Tax=Aliarcobacter butzleri TaxID=28197 RepID=UPI001269CBFB|nr:hypothetical protein [Aliarcobacter butzleri]
MQTDLFELDTKRDRERAKKHTFKTSFTIFKSKSPLNKTITEDGKKYSNAYFSDGNFTTVTISSLLELKKILLKLTKFEALGLGIHKDKLKGEIAPKSRSKELARSKENFKWNDSFNLVMLDFDYFEGINKINSASQYKDILEAIEPSLKNVQMLISKSTSSLVFNNKNKKSLYENGGYHCYIIIKGSVERFKELLWRSCWAKGYGAIKFAADGSILSRTIFDAAVLSPERLVFEAVPTIEGDLSLLPRDIKIFNNSGSYLDIDDMESNIGNGLKYEIESKQNAKATSLQLKEVYIQKHARELSEKTNISYDIAKKIIEAKTDNSGIIYEDDLIYFPNGTTIVAKDLTTEHDGMYILDPVEPDQANAVLNVSITGEKNIHSFLHGGRSFDIVPADLDTKLVISKEAKNLAQSFLKDIWNELFSYGYSEKMYENWEIMFQAYIEASKPDFNTMYIISASAGAAKTTSLAHFIKCKIIETKGKFTSLVVVNTIQNGLDFKNFLNLLLDREDKDQKLPRPSIMFAKDKEIMEDDEGNKIEYTSDVNNLTCTQAEILIITHARLRKAVINGNTEHLLTYEANNNLFANNRDFFAVDEAIDFEEKALIKQSQSYLVIGALQSLKTSYKANEDKEKLTKLINVINKFIDFCENISDLKKINIMHNAEDIFGKSDDLSICFDKEFINIVCENSKTTNINLESYFTDLAILVKSNFFHINSGGEGIIISSNIDRIPSSKGFVILDASAVINHEYMHYITKQKAKRVRVHLDAKRYDEVTIYTSDENNGVGKIDVPSSLLKPESSKNKTVNKEDVEKIENFKKLIQQEVLDKTTKDDIILIITNKSFNEYLKTNLILDRTYFTEHFGNLTGRNDLRKASKVFIFSQPYKPQFVYYGKAYKHDKIEDVREINKFRVSMLIDEVYQAILRANLRTNDEITKNAPKCDIYIRTSVHKVLSGDSQKLINALEKMLIGVKITKWKFVDKEQNKYSNLPDTAYKMKDILLEWSFNNPHDSYVEYSVISKMRSDVFDTPGKKVHRYKSTMIGENVTVMDWIENQTGLKYLGGFESKSYLEEHKGISFSGKGPKCFCRI